MTDIRKKYILNIAGIYFNTNSYENDDNVLGQIKLEQFLDNEQCVILCATCTSSANNSQIEFHNEVVPFVNRMVIFFKNRQSRLNETNVYEIIQLVILQGSPTASLYHTLHNVFTPLLLQEGKKSNAVNLNLQRQLTTFQTSLRSAAFVADGDGSNLSENNSLSVISTLEHEVEYWNSLANSAKTSDIKNSSLAFRDILKPLARDFSMLDALPLLEIEDALEGAHNVLDDLWRHDPPYRRTRMQHLMDLIASDVIHCIIRQLSNIKIWEDDYIDVTDLLEQSINTGKKWNSACTHLTQLFWPNYSLHPWTGDSYTPQSLVDLVTRLEDVLNLRAIHRQLTRLLNHNETEDLQTSEMFKPFANLNVLQCGPYSENSWKTAVKQFEYLLLPAEQRVGEKLKVQLANVSNNTRQLLYEFTRYSQLMDRPVVKKILLAERQNLLSSLGQYIKHLSGMIINESSYSKSDTPRIITEISNIRQLESKGQVVQQTAEKLLNDLPGYEELQAQVNEFIKELKAQHSELFDSWTRELTVQINNKSLSLKESDPVIQFSSAQFMRVNYSPRLVSLVHEYRQLCAMGYRIPTHIAQTAAHAKQFMKYARALEQVANFHNTIGDRMVSVQRPMMLAGALELSRLVQQEEVVSWGDVRSVEKYVESLRKAVNRLSRENNLLATYHMQMLDKIKELSDVDLIRHLQKWKDTAKYLRDIMNQVEQQGFTNMQSWKLEIDRTLSTEFEKQYRQSLETVHLHLPEIYADLVYRDSRLQFNPSEDKLREKYQYQLKRFLDLPRSFRGVSDITEGSVFTEIIETCKDLYAQTEKHTEELFERLKGVVEHWQSWLSLGVLDTSQLVTWQHWDLNFRASKTFGQEVAKLPSTEERVGCFVISLSCLRSDLESHNRSYWSQLMSSLQDSIAQDVVRLQQYVNTSTATLTKQPLTMEQIGQAHASHSDILKQMPDMQKLFEEMVDKNKTLASWTRERVESVARLQTAWERLQSLVDNHQHLISKQVEAFQSTINRTCENLNNEIERFSLHWDQFKPRPGSGQIANDSLKNLENYLVTMKEKKTQWDELVKQKDKVLSDCEQFGMDPPEFSLCDQVQTDIDQEEKVWVLFEEFNADLEKLSKEEWIVFRKRSYKLEEFVSDWQKRLESSQSTALSTRLLQELQKYEDVVPVLKYLRGEDFTEKHWMEVFTLLGIPQKPVDVLTLYDFLEVSSKVSENVAELQAICKRAASEVVVRQALAELDQWEVQSRFLLTEHQDSQKHTVMLVKDFKDILNKIGDNQSLLQSVKNSADYESFSERAGLWETRLADLDHFLVSLSQIQRKWVYLEPIFGSGTLRQERGRFDRLDRDFRHVLNSIERDSRVTSLARYPNIRTVLDTLQDQLSRCQNSLDNFLSEKRLKFPRFLFLGDDDLLEILGQSSREQVIQAHLKKLFSGIHTVKMSSDTKEIIAMCSLQGEVVPLEKPVNIDCPVEDWLNDLVSQMQNTLRQQLKQCLIDSQQSGPDPLQYPSQVLCLSDSITFTTRCEQAIKSATLPPLLATYKNQLKSYSLFELTNEEPSGPSSESKDENVLELKLKALMLDTIQHIDVVDELIDNNVTSLNDWHWQKQLRFYNNMSNDTVMVHMANAQMNYSFEYLGNASKLVRTPLTDKCFLTLTQGMHLGMGGNPYGPAGTGKTESVKALGSLLGRQVLVFNCDEGVDATSMGRILSGLVRSGAWGCFDEFNRLDEATLSAVSMHIQPIQVALRTGRKTLTLLDQQMDINPHCGIFVTLNPVGGGYKGRNRLPDNLKQLFRPVVMSHPDHEQITRTLLRCDGYQNADLIGKKLVEVFSMANELLSKQQHYDWGLRALKTVLGGCGTALNRIRRTRDYLINSNITNAEDDILKREMQLVVEALRVNTLSKLTYADSERFDSLVSDVFVGVPFQNTGHEKLVAALEESCSELGFQVNDRQISKCVELYEQLQQRMGVTIVGPSGSGKSTLRKLLLRALNKMSKSVTQHVFNPKAMTRAQLLGQIDLDTRQWTDGVLTLYALQVYAEPNEVWSWVVCDGDIDPEWVESLNSVLDDNRLLTLPSGWRIQFGPNVNFLFETHDLSYASPATVSRMGIVFLSEEDVKLGDIVNNWLSWQPENTLRISTHLLNDYFFKAIDWIKTEGDLVIPISNVSIVQTGLSQLRKISSKTQFTVALIAGLGGLLNEQTRETFAQKVFEWTGEHCPDEKSFLRCLYNANRDVIDIYYSDTNYQILDTNLNDLPLVLTGQVLQTLDILKPWLSVGTEEHFLLIGPHGSAKSLLINYLVREQHNMDIATIYCSNNIMPQYVLHKLTQHCMVVSSNRGRVYRPKKGRLVLYFKGLHLLKPDKWGTNILIAFLHQVRNHQIGNRIQF